MTEPALIISGIPFYEAPSEIEGAPYWVDLWADVNGYKIGLQIKPQSYHAPFVASYMGKSKTSEEAGHRQFIKDFGGDVFIISPNQGKVTPKIEKQITDCKEKLLSYPPKR